MDEQPSLAGVAKHASWPSAAALHAVPLGHANPGRSLKQCVVHVVAVPPPGATHNASAQSAAV
ncbi:MAG TPA: hypothetical protein VIV58_15445, partial [Kofleriaceae bacterium]